MKFGSNILFSAAAHLVFVAGALFFVGRDAVPRVPVRYIQVTLLNHEAEVNAGVAADGKAVAKAVPAPVPRHQASLPKPAPSKIRHKTEIKAAPAVDKKKVAHDVPVSVPLPGKQLTPSKVFPPQPRKEMTAREKDLTFPVMENRDLRTASGGLAADIPPNSVANPSGRVGGTGTAISSAAGLLPSGRHIKDSGTGYGGPQAEKNGNYNVISEIRAAIERAKRYPLFARKRGIEGTVSAEFSINAEGLPENVAIKRSSGFTVLDSAAKETIIRAAPFPVVAGKIEIPITFRLKQEE
jgi:periplasmic protein TonB